MPLFSSSRTFETDFAWEVATLFPQQGEWSEEAYLDLTDRANRRIEFVEGRLEFLAMPTEIHEAIVQFLFLALHQFVEKRKLGKVYFSGIRLRVRPRRMRLPDIIFLHKDHFSARHNRVWDAADLVMEVVSENPEDTVRDYREKLIDYADARVAEYWIIDPQQLQVVVHRLEGERYVIDNRYIPGEQAQSILLDGFSVDVGSLFAVVDDIPK
jgi:Uma2 family endonuclease